MACIKSYDIKFQYTAIYICNTYIVLYVIQIYKTSKIKKSHKTYFISANFNLKTSEAFPDCYCNRK